MAQLLFGDQDQAVIRPFDLRDVPLLRQLVGYGVALDSREALIESHRPLRDAVLSYLFAGRGTPTFVLRSRQSGEVLQAFGQLRIRPMLAQKSLREAGCRGQAHLIVLASWPEEHESSIWAQMLDALTVQAGRCGAHSVLAQTADDGPTLEILRQSDFAVYTRQEIWMLKELATPPEKESMRPERAEDQWYAQQLIANTVPRLIQQIEQVEQSGLGLVWMGEGHMLAYACVQRGPRGHWVQLYLHPQVDEHAHSIIQQVVAYLGPTPRNPLYCCVRRYQEWLNRPLEESGFELVGSQAVMVRHTTVRVPQPEFSPVPISEKRLEATSPIAHSRAEHEI